MAVDWPTSLGSMRLPATEARSNALIRTAMDAGPAKVRRRYTGVVRTIKWKVRWTRTQYNTFLTFFVANLDEGALPFNYTDPLSLNGVDMRFVVPDGGFEFTWDNTDRVTATLAAEILP